MTGGRKNRPKGRPSRGAMGTLGEALVAAGYRPDGTIQNPADAVPPEPPAPPKRDRPITMRSELTVARPSPKADSPQPLRGADSPLEPMRSRRRKNKAKAGKPAPASINNPKHLAPPKGGQAVFAAPPMQSPRHVGDAARDTSLEACRQRIERRLAGLGAAFAVREFDAARQVEVDQGSAADLSRRLAAARRHPSSGEPVEIVLGIDFGTTSTKVVARRPYDAGSPAAAMPTLAFARPERHPHLWASRLWSNRDNRLTLTPEADAEPVCAVKTRLMEGDGLEHQVQAAAFLGQIIAHARGWLIDERPDFVGARRPEWRYHFGFPAASLDDDGLASRYRRVVAAALSLAELGRPPTIREAQIAIETGSPSPETLAREGVLLFPEVAGATAAFVASRSFAGDLYVMVDIGGGTVDVCTFNLHKPEEGLLLQPIYAAAIDLLGVEPWRLCEDQPGGDFDFGRCLDAHIRRVIWDTKRDHAPHSICWQEGLPVLVIGGGVASPRHEKCVANLDGWLRHRQRGCPGGTLVQLAPSPGNFQHDAGPTGAHRLTVALGLSLPDESIPEVLQRIPPVMSFTRHDINERYIGAEMT